MSASPPLHAPTLSVAQEALWDASVIAPRRASYNEVISIRKDGPLDLASFRDAFAAVVARHDAWHTAFELVSGEPVAVHCDTPVELPLLDLSELSAEGAERRAVEIVAEVARVPYNLRLGPLVRPRLFRFSAEHHRLYLAMHHLAFDGVSVARTVLPELIALYDACRLGRPSPLPKSVSYGDYARWEREWVAGPRAVRRIDWWRRHLTSPPTSRIALDHPRPETLRARGGTVGVSVSAETAAVLRSTGQAAGVTLFQVVASVWAMLLARYSGQGEAVFATAADLRQRPEFQSVVGYCLTPLVLRVDLSGRPTFPQLLRRVRDELLDGLDHIVPFERLVRELQPEAAQGSNPIYQTMLVLEPASVTPDPSWSLHFTDPCLGSRVGISKLDLELQLDERADGHIDGRLIYDVDVFDAPTAARLVGHWQTLLNSVVAGPERVIGSLEMLTPCEREQLHEWNATAVRWPPGVDEGCELLVALAAELGLGPGDTVLALPDARETGEGMAVALARISGATLIEASSEQASSGAQISRLIRNRGVTFLAAAPGAWERLIATGLRTARAVRVLSGGAPLSSAVAAGLIERFPVVWNAYVSRELGGPRLLGRVEDASCATLGRPLANTRAHVLDGVGQPAPIGVAGELWLAGHGIDVGLHSTLGAEAVRSEPDGPGLAARTGDRVRRLADGSLELALG